MKRNVILGLALMLSAVLFFGCVSTAPVATTPSEPVVVVEEPPRLESSLSVAVLEFEGGSGQDAITLADLFGTRLANRRIFNVLTRTSVDAIMKEHNFQRIGVSDTESIKAIGELVNADYIIVGKITTLGDENLLTVQMINIVNGNIESGGDVIFENLSETLPYIDSMVDTIAGIETATKPVPKTVVEPSENISTASIVNDTTIAMYEGKRGIEEIKFLLSRGINATDDDGYTALMFAAKYAYTELVKELIAAGANINATTYEGTSAVEIADYYGHKGMVRVLKDAGATAILIGDKGPGGGLVFYIEGDTYLECSEVLGNAKWDDAITLAEDYRGNIYDDWYLPSKDELDYIYKNLRVEGFISDDEYFWSSSEFDNFRAWSQNFSNGNQFQYNSSKNSSRGVRAVRAFNPSTP